MEKSSGDCLSDLEKRKKLNKELRDLIKRSHNIPDSLNKVKEDK